MPAEAPGVLSANSANGKRLSNPGSANIREYRNGLLKHYEPKRTGPFCPSDQSIVPAGEGGEKREKENQNRRHMTKRSMCKSE